MFILVYSFLLQTLLVSINFTKCSGASIPHNSQHLFKRIIRVFLVQCFCFWGTMTREYGFLVKKRELKYLFDQIIQLFCQTNSSTKQTKNLLKQAKYLLYQHIGFFVKLLVCLIKFWSNNWNLTRLPVRLQTYLSESRLENLTQPLNRRLRRPEALSSTFHQEEVNKNVILDAPRLYP